MKAPHLLKGQSGLVSVLVTEIIVHPKVCLSAELVSGLTVWDALDDAALMRQDQGGEGLNIHDSSLLIRLEEERKNPTCVRVYGT